MTSPAAKSTAGSAAADSAGSDRREAPKSPTPDPGSVAGASSASSSTAAIEAALERSVRAELADLPLPGTLVESIAYSLLAPGKRLRPRLVWHACEAVGGDPARAALAPAVAIEMIHCFSLIHDDLPAMDDDDLRRGRPTNHVQFGEAMAILAGDALATLPYLVIARASGLAATVRAALVEELASGTACMISGQVYDTLGGFPPELADQPEARIQIVDRNKTGALIRGACRMGAIAGGADPSQLDRLTEYGRAMGYMFQIVDDVLDVTQTDEQMGKRTGKDEAAGKLTYPGVFGLRESRARIEQLRDQAVEALRPLGDAAGPLVVLANKMAVRTR